MVGLDPANLGANPEAAPWLSNAFDPAPSNIGAILTAKSGAAPYPASAKIINEKVRVYSKKVKMPKRVRYGWKNYFDATLFNSEGLPASSFQTE